MQNIIANSSPAVWKLGCTGLVFVEPEVKINGQYYRDVLLSQELLPAIREIAGDVFVFQQDGAPAHRARETVEFLRRDTPDFIAPDLWPPNSPDLNPVDYKIWGCVAGESLSYENTRCGRLEAAFDRHLVWHSTEHH